MPPWLPRRRGIVYASGLAELACAAGLWHPTTRRTAGLATAALLLLVFPANIQMALDARRASRARRWLAFGRLPVQAPLVWWAIRIAATADRRCAR